MNNTLAPILIFILGSSAGSFLNVLILRMPKLQKITGRSHCPHCGKILAAWELIPIFSFLFLGARCRTCGQKISWRYPLIEAITGLCFVLFWLAIGPQNLGQYLFLLETWFLAAFAIAVFVIDLENYLILDWLVFPVALIFLILNLAQDLSLHQNFKSTLEGLVGAAAGVLPFYLIWRFSKGRLMGFGDVKLMLVLGLVLGWPNILVALLLAVFSGSLVGISFLILGKKTLKSPLPFGCFLATGALFAQVYGSQLIGWYLSFLGI